MELRTRVDHLVLAKGRQIITTQGVVVAAEKGIFAGERGCIGLDLRHQLLVLFALLCRWITRAMAREYLDESELAIRRPDSRDTLISEREVWRVLAPVMGDVREAVVSTVDAIALLVTVPIEQKNRRSVRVLEGIMGLEGAYLIDRQTATSSTVPRTAPMLGTIRSRQI